VEYRSGEVSLVLESPKVVGTQSVVKEHMLLRQRDFEDDCKIFGKMAIGAMIEVTGYLGEYNPDGKRSKKCLFDISKIKVVGGR
jgi:hypothetical protein